MKKFLYSGFYCPNETFADNTNEWERVAADKSVAAIERRDAWKNLAFLKLFPPGRAHSRLAGHLVGVKQVKDLTWARSGRLWTPQGAREEIFSLDVSGAVKNACERIFNEPPQIIERDAVFHFPDGSEIRGTRVRTSNFAGLPCAKKFPCDYLTLEFDCSRFGRSGYFSYGFGIPTKAVEKPEEPKEFIIVSFVTVGGVEIQRQTKKLWPQFVSGTQDRPEEFSHFCHRTSTEDKLLQLAGLPPLDLD